jgi:hypothetical protein
MPRQRGMHRSGCSSHKRVEPSRSVNKKLTVPVGNSAIPSPLRGSSPGGKPASSASRRPNATRTEQHAPSALRATPNRRYGRGRDALGSDPRSRSAGVVCGSGRRALVTPSARSPSSWASRSRRLTTSSLRACCRSFRCRAGASCSPERSSSARRRARTSGWSDRGDQRGPALVSARCHQRATILQPEWLQRAGSRRTWWTDRLAKLEVSVCARDSWHSLDPVRRDS